MNISQAVASLRPGIEWSMSGDDVAGITWHTPDVEPLTQAEVTKEMKRLEALAKTTDADRVADLQPPERSPYPSGSLSDARSHVPTIGSA